MKKLKSLFIFKLMGLLILSYGSLVCFEQVTQIQQSSAFAKNISQDDNSEKPKSDLIGIGEIQPGDIQLHELTFGDHLKIGTMAYIIPLGET